MSAPTVAAVRETVAAQGASDAHETPGAPQVASGSQPVDEQDAAGGALVRRGLPRTVGGEPWPPAGTTFRPASATSAQFPAEGDTRSDEIGEPSAASGQPSAQQPSAEQPSSDLAPVAASTAVEPSRSIDTPLPFTRTVWAGRTPRVDPDPAPEPRRYGPFTRVQWAGAVIVAGVGLLFAAGMAVLAVRWFLSLEFMRDFLTTYPGEYHLPEGAPVGFQAWLGWQHFFNTFLMVLIIRSGLEVRHQKRPPGLWSPRWNRKRKISLSLWFHQSLDVLWIANGLVFIVLLFVTGQWMRIVPTSWEVIPNTVSAALQYVSWDWPTENGWVNYNALQQLAYFTTVFLAAPLAILTGVRMSGIWPSKAKTLNRIYPVEWARAVHFPVMIYFVLFIVVHVTLVFATGALRNLNHMYAVQGSTDPDAYADNWAGFWIFTASTALIIAAWIAARPLVLAPIARLLGNVSRV